MSAHLQWVLQLAMERTPPWRQRAGRRRPRQECLWQTATPEWEDDGLRGRWT